MNEDEAIDLLLHGVAHALLALRPAAPDLALIAHCYALSRVTADALTLLGVKDVRLVIGHADGVDPKHRRPIRTKHAWVEVAGRIIDPKMRLARIFVPTSPLAYTGYVEEPGAPAFGLGEAIDDAVWPLLARAATGKPVT